MAWLDFGQPASSNIGTSRLGPAAPERGAAERPEVSALGHKLAAIDLDNLPNDIGAERLRGEEQVSADAFFGGSEASDRNRLANGLQGVGVRIALMKRRHDHAGRHPIDADLLANQLLGVALRNRRNKAFCGGVEDCAAGAAVSRRN